MGFFCGMEIVALSWGDCVITQFSFFWPLRSIYIFDISTTGRNMPWHDRRTTTKITTKQNNNKLGLDNPHRGNALEHPPLKRQIVKFNNTTTEIS